MSAEIQPRSPRVLITNTVALNMGDAAILEGTVEIVRQALGRDARIAVYDRRPQIARRYYPELRFRGTPWGRRGAAKRRGRGFAGWARKWRLYAGAWCYGRGLGRVTRLWLGDRERAALARYAGADLVVSTGGTYLVENYALEERISDYELTLLTRSPLVFFTQSLGPFRHPGYRRSLRRIFDRARLVLLRDERSLDHVRELGVGSDRLKVTADAAFSLPSPTPSGGRRRRSPDAPRIAISVRYWQHFSNGDLEERNGRYRAAIGELVEHVVERRRADVTFVSTCQGVPEYRTDDSATAELIAEQLPAHVRERVHVDRAFHRPADYMRLLAEFDLSVATRMHAGILALIAGTPVLPIAYEFKTHELFARLGMAEWVQDIESVTGASLRSALDGFVEALPSLEGPLFEGVAREQALAREGRALLQAAASRAPGRPASRRGRRGARRSGRRPAELAPQGTDPGA